MDLNGDGHGDILSGSYSRMDKAMAGLFQVLWGQPDGTFKKAAVLSGSDDEPLIIPVENSDPATSSDWTENICTRPTAVDWDADGDLDLVVGNFPGSFYLFAGKGDGVFLPEAKPILSGDSPLKIQGHHSDPFVVDWDNDGDLDLLSGSSSGGVHWAENIAGAGKLPELKSFRTLIDATSTVQYGQTLSESDLTGPTSATRIWVDDVNSDGKLDILVGDNVALVSPAAGVSVEEFKEKQAEWQEAVKQVSTAISSSDEKERNEANRRFSELYSQRSEFMNEDRTGFVWLYLQK